MADSGIMIHGRHGFDFEFEPCAFRFTVATNQRADWRATVAFRLEPGDRLKVILKTPIGYLAGAALVSNVSLYGGEWETEIVGDGGLTHYREAGDAMEAGGF